MTLPYPPASQARLLDLAHIDRTLRTRLPFSSRLEHCLPLPGDASNRRYFRLVLARSSVPSVILMQLADPEGFKASEETVSQPVDIDELPFVNVHRYLQRLALPVPELYYYDHSAGLLYLEDLGDQTLEKASTTGTGEQVKAWYGQAVASLVHLQCRSLEHARTRATNLCMAFQRGFDVALLMWEFEHFLEFGIEARRGTPMPPGDRQRAREAFHDIATYLAEQPRVLTHRDYHSRNLMVQADRLAIIDFQDALLGPITYDLASLLRDSYVTLDDGFLDQMIDYYLTGMRAALPRSVYTELGLDDASMFRRLLDFTSIQRNLKAAGRFVYIDRVKGNAKFLVDIPRTLTYVLHNLKRYPELSVLRAALTPYVPEWQ